MHFTADTQVALARLRDTTSFNWSAVPLLTTVLYAFSNEIQAGRIGAVLGSISTMAVIVFLEVVNMLVAYISIFAPIMTTPNHGTTLLLLVGLNYEVVCALLLVNNRVIIS